MVQRPNRVRSNLTEQDARSLPAESRVPQHTINDLMELMDRIEEYLGEMRRLLKGLKAQGLSDVEVFKVEDPVRLRKTGGAAGIVRAADGDGWVGVEWSHSLTEWVRADELERA